MLFLNTLQVEAASSFTGNDSKSLVIYSSEAWTPISTHSGNTSSSLSYQTWNYDFDLLFNVPLVGQKYDYIKFSFNQLSLTPNVGNIGGLSWYLNGRPVSGTFYFEGNKFYNSVGGNYILPMRRRRSCKKITLKC